jgi:membrane fusion protein, multidrug efflux system
VNASTGSVNLRALVANAQRRLLPGMFVTLIVDFGQQNNVFLVPQQALVRDTSGGYVLVVGADGKVARRDIETTDSTGNDWIVTHGLNDGDEVVVTGVQVAHEGAPVKRVAWQPPPAPGSAPVAPVAPTAPAAPAASAGTAK